MNPSVDTVETQENYQLKLVFDNGEARLFDVTPYLDKGIFKQLKDKHYFKKAFVAFGAVQWPNQQDFSKDTLYLLSEPI